MASAPSSFPSAAVQRPANFSPEIKAMMMLVWSLLAFWAIQPALSKFSQPTPFRREAWTIGDVETVQWDTEFSEYTVGLWQRAVTQEAATLGPIIYQRRQDGPAQFNWTVQLYDFDLADSNVFFFWMFEGVASLQGNQSAAQLSSPYFNITLQPNTSPRTTLNSRLPTSTSTWILTTETSTALPATDTTISIIPNEEVNDDGVTGGRAASSDNGILVAVTVGIGVGLVGFTCIGCTFLLWRHLRMRRAFDSLPAVQVQESEQVWKPPPSNAPQYDREVPVSRELAELA